MNNKLYLNKVIFDLETLFWFFIFTVLLALNYLGIDFSGTAIIVAIISSVSTCLRSSNIQLIIQIFALSYWVSLVPFYFYNIPYHIFTEYQSEYATNFVVLAQACFTRLIFSHALNNTVDYSRLLECKSRLVFLCSIIIAYVFAIIVLFTNKTILGVGYIERNDQGSILMEYALIPVIVAYIHSRTNYERMVVLVLCIIFIIVPLLYGKRLPSLFFLILLYAFFFQKKIGRVGVAIFTVLGLIGMNAIGVVRDGVGFDNLSELLFGYKSEGYFSNNQGGVAVSSVTYFSLVEDQILNFMFSIKSFIGQFLVIFIPSKFAFEETFINLYVIDNYISIPGAGGFTSIYFYIWGGFIGLYIGFLVFFLIFRIKTNNIVISMIHLLLLVTFFRWFGYNLFPVGKIIFWFLVYFLLMNLFANTFRYARG